MLSISEESKMKITYDPEADALYISFKEKKGEVTTIRITEDFAVDLGDGEEVVGIEILDASSYFKIQERIPEIELENVKPV